MWKPMAVLASLVIGASFAVVMCNRSVLQVSATGQPLDLRGGIVSCPKCPHGVGIWQQRGYEFHCDDCGANYRLRWNADGEIETDW